MLFKRPFIAFYEPIQYLPKLSIVVYDYSPRGENAWIVDCSPSPFALLQTRLWGTILNSEQLLVFGVFSCVIKFEYKIKLCGF